jgi:D-xylulose reductase
MTALAALSGGCSRVLVTNLVQEKLDVIGRYSGATTTNGKTKTLPEEVAKLTNSWAPMSC